MLTALSELSRFPDQSVFNLDPKARKITQQPNLRALIENQQIASYKKFLNSFKEVKDGVIGLESELNALHDVCNSMAKNLTASKQNSRNLIDEIAKLETERKKLVKERDLAAAYRNAFQLDADDIRILRTTESTTDMLSPEFFTVRCLINRNIKLPKLKLKT